MTVSVYESLAAAGKNQIKNSLVFKMAPLKITTEICTVCNPFAKNCVRAIQADFCIISHHHRTKNCIMAGSYIYWWQLPTRMSEALNIPFVLIFYQHLSPTASPLLRSISNSHIVHKAGSGKL